MGLQKTVILTGAATAAGVLVLFSGASYLSDKPMASFLRRFTTSASTAKPLSVLFCYLSNFTLLTIFWQFFACLRKS
jgi:hypothetical protein